VWEVLYPRLATCVLVVRTRPLAWVRGRFCVSPTCVFPATSYLVVSHEERRLGHDPRMCLLQGDPYGRRVLAWWGQRSGKLTGLRVVRARHSLRCSDDSDGLATRALPCTGSGLRLVQNSNTLLHSPMCVIGGRDTP